jgi:hypothetical protein
VYTCVCVSGVNEFSQNLLAVQNCTRQKDDMRKVLPWKTTNSRRATFQNLSQQATWPRESVHRWISTNSWFDRMKVIQYCLQMVNVIQTSLYSMCRSQLPRALRCGSTAAPLLGLQVRIPSRAWMSVCCECCVLSGRGIWVGLINSCSKLNCSNPQLLTAMSAASLILSFNIRGSIKCVFFYSRFLIETFYGFPFHYDNLWTTALICV